MNLATDTLAMGTDSITMGANEKEAPKHFFPKALYSCEFAKKKNLKRQQASWKIPTVFDENETCTILRSGNLTEKETDNKTSVSPNNCLNPS